MDKQRRNVLMIEAPLAGVNIDIDNSNTLRIQ